MVILFPGIVEHEETSSRSLHETSREVTRVFQARLQPAQSTRIGEIWSRHHVAPIESCGTLQNFASALFLRSRVVIIQKRRLRYSVHFQQYLDAVPGGCQSSRRSKRYVIKQIGAASEEKIKRMRVLPIEMAFSTSG